METTIESDHDLLVRIDEKLKAVIDNYVTKKEFAPVKIIVYGMVGIILTSVMGGLITLVVVK
ncbi:MAG: hypothetical protein WC764_04395 [Candidatus Paceibacterota bacterium]|jgi:hypothetical protein